MEFDGLGRTKSLEIQITTGMQPTVAAVRSMYYVCLEGNVTV